MSNKAVYIAGPMQNYPEFNFPAFKSAKRSLESIGWNVFCPATEDGIDTTGMKGLLSEIPDFCLKKAMKRNCHAIADCDAIYMLKGWEHSRGARVEHSLASYLGLDILYQ